MNFLMRRIPTTTPSSREGAKPRKKAFFDLRAFASSRETTGSIRRPLLLSDVARSLLSLLILVTFCTLAHAQFTTGTTSGLITITGYTGPGGAVTIPSTINGLPVTSIGTNAFRSCTTLTSVRIPDSVTSLGSYAFGYCSKLTSVTIPGSVTSIGNNAFYNCTKLTEAVLGTSVTSLGSNVFGGCDSLIAITVDANNPAYSSSPDGVLFNRIQSVLVQCPGGKLGSYAIPNTVISIGAYAFYNCALTGVAIPNSVNSIGNYAFYSCPFTDVTIPNSVVSIGTYAFESCTNLTSVAIPNSVSSIGVDAFYGCTQLTSATIGTGVTSIGSNAFYGCNSLTAITVDPNNPAFSSSADGVLFNKTKSSLIQFPGGKTGTYAIPGTVTTLGNYAFHGCSLTGVTIPDSVISLGTYTFQSSTNLTSVTLPGSITTIGNYAFYGCTSLPSVTIPGSVVSIGSYAFYNCSKLPGVTFPASVGSIGTYAFGSCDSLASVTIPKTVVSIGANAFYACASLTSITVDPGNAGYSSVDGILFDQNQTVLIQCPGGRIGNYAIPSSVLSVGNYAFAYCQKLTGLTIPGTVSTIGTYAFEDCTKLTAITIGDGVGSIGNYAFAYCSTLTGVMLPASVVNIGNNGFYACSKMKSALFVGNAPIMGTSVFNSAATGFTVYYFSGGANFSSPTWNGYAAVNLGLSTQQSSLQVSINPSESVDSGAQWRVDGNGGWQASGSTLSTLSVGLHTVSFSPVIGWISPTDQIIPIIAGQTAQVTGTYTPLFDYTTANGQITITGYNGTGGTVSIPDTISVSGTNLPVTAIGPNAFFFCSSVTSVTIPDSVTSIGSDAFYNCTGLASITIPAGVISIGTYAFQGCDNLASITVDPANPAYCSADGVLFDKAQATLIRCPGGKAGTYAIPDGVVTILSYAFEDCVHLTGVTIPSSVTSIAYNAFYGCDSLGAITAAPTNPAYSSSADGILYDKAQTVLIECPGGKAGSVVIPSSVSGIGSYAFYGCASLTSVAIPGSVTSIGDAAFEGCTGLTGVTIPGSVTSIGNSAFNGCTGLTHVTIPDSVTSVGTGAFESCTGLTSVTISNSLASLAYFMFDNCSKLTGVTIPSSVTSIGVGAFEGCDKLTGLTIPDTVTSIGSSAFYGSGLTDVTIPGGVTSIGGGAFDSCLSLTSITVEPANLFYSALDGVLFNKNRTTLIQFPAGKVCSSYAIPNGVTSIGDDAFEDCTSLVSVTIPASMTSIGSDAFWYCSSLASVNIPNSVTSIGSYAFYDCNNLTSVTIPSSITNIGSYAFESCNSLTSACFMGNAPLMGWGVFSGAASGFTVKYYDDATGFGTPTWMDSSGDSYPAIPMGVSPLASWLISKGFSATADLQSAPNRDGIPLLMAYALNLDPRQNLSHSIPQPVVVGKTMSLRFYAASAGITYTVQTSSDLKTWGTTGVTLSGPDVNNCYTAIVPITDAPCFMRLKVVR